MSNGDFGAQLKQARERRGISLRQIATSTKIAVTALEALERNDFSRLPGGVFSRAFVRAYAVEVGLDAEETVREFLVQKDAAEAAAMEHIVKPDVTADDEAFLERQRKAGIVLRVVVIAIVVIIVGLIVMWRINAAARSAAVGTPTAPATAEPAPAAAASVSPPPAPAQSDAPHTSQFRVVIAPTDTCWVQVTVDGAIALKGRDLANGERQQFDVTREIYIQVGDAGAFAWTINGKPGKPLGRSGDVRQKRVTVENFNEFVQ
jgi:cytoskeletal protein RodZ